MAKIGKKFVLSLSSLHLSICNHYPLSSQLHHQDILQKKRTKEDDGMCVKEITVIV